MEEAREEQKKQTEERADSGESPAAADTPGPEGAPADADKEGGLEEGAGKPEAQAAEPAADAAAGEEGAPAVETAAAPAEADAGDEAESASEETPPAPAEPAPAEGKPGETPSAGAEPSPMEEKPAEASQEKAEKGATPAEKVIVYKKEKPTNCEECDKPLAKKGWYYRNGKYFCKKKCWKSNHLKTMEEQEGAEG